MYMKNISNQYQMFIPFLYLSLNKTINNFPGIFAEHQQLDG